MINLFFLLIFGHCIADTSLQPDSMSRGKSRHNPIDPNRVPVGQKPMKLWYMWLTHHSFIHGGIVYIITGSFLYFYLEIISHWIIDFFKCESKFDPRVDQLLHIIIKLIFVILFILGIK
uniref:DUF3307 domain-containing protein n=1 Tax=viral metagenome TaxID=1070528 RepID=A0A6M3KVD6_9ZZZZ